MSDLCRKFGMISPRRCWLIVLDYEIESTKKCFLFWRYAPQAKAIFYVYFTFYFRPYIR